MSVTAHPLTVRIGQWIAGRHGPESGDVLLDRRRVYILPTTPGLVFGAAILVLLIGSINYDLQLGYVLTFLVTSMAIVGMHTTHSNLAQLVLRGIRAEPVFAGDVAIFEVTATNPTTVDRFALRFAFIDPIDGAAPVPAADEAPAHARSRCRSRSRHVAIGASACHCPHPTVAACRHRASSSSPASRSACGAPGPTSRLP